jgi:hypothetical protein
MAGQSFFQAIEVASRAHVLSHGRIIREFDRAHAQHRRRFHVQSTRPSSAVIDHRVSTEGLTRPRSI